MLRYLSSIDGAVRWTQDRPISVGSLRRGAERTIGVSLTSNFGSA